MRLELVYVGIYPGITKTLQLGLSFMIFRLFFKFSFNLQQVIDYIPLRFFPEQTSKGH